MQNKAVVNEETANDVKLLREQIRQLKVGLVICLACLAGSLTSTLVTNETGSVGIFLVHACCPFRH
jgi:hypothetical protein